jgi:O-antigen/teichoic acid export membrane protein
LSLPLFVLTLGFPEWVLGLFGPNFVGGATALRILALGQLINILAGPIGVVLLMTGNERQSLYVSVISLAMLAICCFTLIPAYGLNGAAMTTTLIIAARTLTSVAMVRRLFRTI